jgi:hypothetical protein
MPQIREDYFVYCNSVRLHHLLSLVTTMRVQRLLAAYL